MGLMLEIAVDSVADALTAEAAGAHRLELCSDLASHGLTPRPAVLAEFRRRSALPVAAMVRPRAGAFVPSPSDSFVAPRQGEALLAAGADALVFGFLFPDGSIHEEMTARLVRTAGAAASVFHRAFDLAPDPFRAIDVLAGLGVRRILTAGMSQAVTAHALGLRTGPAPLAEPLETRFARLRAYEDHAHGRIEILACGGVRSANALRFVREAGMSQLHSAGRESGCSQVNADEVRRLADLMRA